MSDEPMFFAARVPDGWALLTSEASADDAAEAGFEVVRLADVSRAGERPVWRFVRGGPPVTDAREVAYSRLREALVEACRVSSVGEVWDFARRVCVEMRRAAWFAEMRRRDAGGVSGS